MSKQLTTTKELAGLKVYGGKKGKRIGKVRHFVFHPSEKRLVGFTVKRPDAALMFKRKDLFVALGGYDLVDGQLHVHDDPDATDKGAIKALGIDWDRCVIWVGMPVLTQSGDMLGYVNVVTFDEVTGKIESMTTENGTANDALLGTRVIPAKLIRGFKRGIGEAIVAMNSYEGEDTTDAAERGAILVDDAVLDLEVEGGAAAAAGKATAIATDKAKKAAGRAKAATDQVVDQVKPKAKKIAEKTGAAVDAGAFAAGRQLGRASGMFSAFKEEFDKAMKEEEDE